MVAVEGKVRSDQADFSDRARGDDLVNQGRLRVRPIHESLDEDEAPRRCSRKHFPGLCLAQCHRFFTENVLPCVQRREGPLVVEGIRQADVDRIDIRAGEERLVTAHCVASVAFHKSRRRVGLARGDRGK